MFYGDLETVIPEPKCIERSAGGPESIQETARLLAEAKRPVIVSGKDKKEPILRLLSLQLQRQRCSRLERFEVGENHYYSKTRLFTNAVAYYVQRQFRCT
jgi:hypothetical protein